MPKADKQLTEARNFLDPKSYVRGDGSEVLFRKDWKARVKELEARSGGRCEYVDGYRCVGEAVDPHHKILRSIRRDDRLSALLHICRQHHNKLDAEQRRQHGKNKIGFAPIGA